MYIVINVYCRGASLLTFESERFRINDWSERGIDYEKDNRWNAKYIIPILYLSLAEAFAIAD